MTILTPVVAASPLRQRLVDEMDLRRFDHETQRSHFRDIGRFATFLGRSPDTANCLRPSMASSSCRDARSSSDSSF